MAYICPLRCYDCNHYYPEKDICMVDYDIGKSPLEYNGCQAQDFFEQKDED